MRKPKRWFLAASVIAFAALLAGPSLLNGPIILYPSSPSLPIGLYVRTFEQVETGKIVAFSMPDKAKRYQIERGHDVPPNFLFMKPIAAGPGDQVCNSFSGLFINGKRIAETVSHDSDGRLLPVWRQCRHLHHDEYFMLSTHIPNSFDSRYFGPVEGAEIAAVYRPLF
ncbi:MAG: S26 family signal peptidase [Geminicoccaceae bacterium]